VDSYFQKAKKILVEGDGFEPPNPKERIYSPPRLATSLPLHIVIPNKKKKMVAQDGIEPPTQGFSVLCSTD
jgi:hypothetical protein